MAEEHEFQSPEGRRHQLCANNCGFFGSRNTKNYCSKCYNDIEEEKSNVKSVDSLFHPPSSTSSEMFSQKKVSEELIIETVVSIAAPQVMAQQNRCLICKKKLGLLGFRCRCGTTFCGIHRYPEVHACAFDFKSMGREAIAKANPLLKADKLEKI
ncbi:zinc finger A20 and AN1 domain-containing stress-associated protein 6-like [Solanum dulcamara]|uniref:zinc finger A20 and AN1 domain-containing stress-associated protein 6-like n=1 Tax=Solanum dulcamara TaxID=45834 RepID=UPI0024854038|nr:zinc finger A20 and AN1 domain-containing stress-associated protein 6-like [Solanum dulcamara]